MKIKILAPLLLFIGISAHAQNNINQLLAAGIEDAERFSNQYTSPASAGIIHSLSNGWYNTAKGKSLGEFEIALVGNGGFVPDDSKEFQLNTDDYNFLRFQDPSVQQRGVATVLGENNPEMKMVIESPDGSTTEITLPQGIGSAGVNTIPTAYLQASVGLLKGTEVKLRFLPKIKIEDVSTDFYGGAIQHEVTSWIPGKKAFPLHISALIGYTAFNGSYNLEDNKIVEGDNQKIETSINSWLFTAIVSTKLPVINFYGGVGYVTGNTDTNLKGTYRIKQGMPEIQGKEITNPYSTSHKASGIKATLGTKLKLGFFRIHADYSFQEFNNVNVGLSFGI